ncbi:MAG TPA: hypothetical protein VHC69_12740 [Polyangiaceae bacterium]|nr:hypothetical protein [Polyangiaceae bacterium]
MSADDKPTILVDAGELRLPRFSGAVRVQRATLRTGHFSLLGSAAYVAIDRYELGSFARLVADPDAFRERCRRLAKHDFRVIVVEAARGAVMPAAIEGCGVPVLFGRTPTGAARIIEKLLTLVWRQQRQRAGIDHAPPFITGGPRPHVVVYDLPDGEEPPVPLGAA